VYSDVGRMRGYGTSFEHVMHRALARGFVDDGAHLLVVEQRAIFALLGERHHPRRADERDAENDSSVHGLTRGSFRSRLAAL
jgi:hypothetical protein